MDEQRFQAHVALIKQLLSCGNGKEDAILQQQSELVDAGLLTVMQQYADWLEQQGNSNAGWLRQFAQRLATILGDTNTQAEENPEDAEKFLREVLQHIVDTQGNPQQVYSFLAQHQDSLNPALLQSLPQVAAALLVGNLEQRQFVAAILFVFGNLIQLFPLGQFWLNLELGIAAYQQSLTVITQTAMPVEWANTMMNLAIAYSRRIRGDRAENIEQAIEACQQSLTVMTQTAMPVEWAQTMMNLANIYSDRIRGDRAENIEQAIEACQQSLTVMTQTAMPVDWAGTMMNLAIAYSKRIRGDRAENIERAIEAYQQALTVMTQTAMPVEWAQTMNNLASAYSKRIRGDRAENIERAIVAYQQALTVRTQSAMPVEWATTMMNLASAYSNRIRDDRAENIERAIEACQQSLTVMTQTAMPVDWAETMVNLASAYSKRIQGDRAENIERAIVAYQQALTVRTQSAMPVDWATTMMNLASAYSNRIRGDRAENIEQAIEACQQALTVMTQATMPVEWAETTVNLGIAYSKRIRGDRAENIEQAIEAYQQSLTVRTQTAMPVDWATTMINLGVDYFKRIRGDRAENIEQAIEAYQQSLTVMTQTAMPVEWATTMMNLAIAYSNRARGDSPEERLRHRAEDIEQAITTYQQSLTVMTQTAMPVEWATTMMNLAIAYKKRIRGDRAENIEQAIVAYQQSLTVRTQAAMPVDWANTMMNLANAYSDRIRGNRAENIEQAIVAYQSSLKVFDPELLPNYCRSTARSLGNLFSEQNHWAEAIPIYQKALKAAELLYQSANLLDGKAAELAETADLPRRAAYALARSGDLQSAVLTLEQGRARGLSETLDRDRADLTRLQQTHPDLSTQYQDITVQLRNLEAQQRARMTSEERHSLTPEAFRTEVLQLRQTLTETIEQIRQVKGYADFLAQPNFADIQQAVRSGVPLVYLVPTPLGSLALIVTQAGIADLWLDKLNETDLVDLLNKTWFSAYEQSRTNYQGWLEAIDQVTHQLWEPLMAPLIDYVKQHHFQQATLIPTGYLSLLPLHAAWTENNTTPTKRRYALDDIHFTYAPNAISLNAATDIAQRTGADSILAIDEPKHRYQDSEGNYKDVNPLPNSTREVQTAIATFQNPKILRHEQATREAVLAVLPHADVLHCSCHGNANLQEPLESGLAMTGDGKAAILTLRDLLDLKLAENNQGGIRLAILSACETGLTGIELADEAIGLPTGLLQAGVAGVVASLWSVDELATAILLVRFYDLWRGEEKLKPHQALRQAQRWLRDTTNKQKKTYFKELKENESTEAIPRSTARSLWSKLVDNSRYRDETSLGFAAPYYWAAFNYVGV